MKKSRGILSLIVAAALIVLLGFTTIVGFGKGHTGSMKNIKLGLDTCRWCKYHISGQR